MIYIYYLILSVILNTSRVHGRPSERSIVVDKPAMRMYVLSVKGDTLASFPVALGKNCGDKRRQGDLKTPEGKYRIVSIEDSSDWDGDASGSDYGPWFMRLGHGKWDHIGIHGTNIPSSVGQRASLGCVRLNNDCLVGLRRLVWIGSQVTILPDTTETYVTPIAGEPKVETAHVVHKRKVHTRRHRRSR